MTMGAISFAKICSHCEELIDEKESYFYIGYWDREKQASNVLNYHRECFKEIAGEDYCQKATEKGPEYGISVDEIVESSQMTMPGGSLLWDFVYGSGSFSGSLG